MSKHEQQSDWGIRPLTNEQICYAAFDAVYLRGVHLQLMQLTSQLEDPAKVEVLPGSWTTGLAAQESLQRASGV